MRDFLLRVSEKTDFSLQRDPYPYSKRDSLTDKSFPAAILYTPNLAGKKLMGKPITNIKRNADMTVSFHFSGNNSQDGISEIWTDDEICDKKEIYRFGETKVWVKSQSGKRNRGNLHKYLGK